MPEAKLKTLSVRLPADLLRSLRVRAAERDTTIQALVESLLVKTLGGARG
jgi:hypothetical protein